MDDNRLRAVLLKLQDRLSEADRLRLHFFLAKVVPRRISDDKTLDGTLKLLESLFDQGKISEENFTYLIDVFRQIGHTEGVQILNEYKEEIQVKCFKQSNTCSVYVPSLNKQIIEDQEDKSATQFLLPPVNNCGQINQIIGSENTTITPLSIKFEDKRIISPRTDKNQPFYIAFKINKCLLSIISLLILITLSLMFILITNINRTNNFERQIREKIRFEIEEKQNLTKREWNEILSNKNNQIFQLKNDIHNSMIKPGEKFGFESGSTPFDDSKTVDFTCSHFLNRIIVRNDKHGLETYEFRYISSNDEQTYWHGKQNIPQITDHRFDENDKIVKVEGQILKRNYPTLNGTMFTKTIITKLYFTSEEGISNPLHGDHSDLNFSESFDGYFLGYITGTESDHINQIQFYWYRKK